MRRLPLYIILFCLGAAVLSAARPESWDEQSARRKADYVFLEAQNAFNHEDYSTYLTLLERARQLNPSDIDIAGEWALTTYSLASEDDSVSREAYSLMRSHFLANPTYINGKNLATAASRSRHYDDVVMVWEMLDSLYPTRQDVAVALANAYVVKTATGDSAALDRAMAIFRRLEDGIGKNTALTSQIIRALMLRADTAAVESELQSLMRANPADSYTALYVGSTFDYLARPDSALKYLDLACALDSANGSAYMARASFFLQQADSAAFDREVFNALNSRDLEVDTKVQILRSYVSELYADSTQQPRITSLFDHLVQLHPGEPEIYSLYAAYLFGSKKPGEAAEQMSYAVALEPENDNNTTLYLQMLMVADRNDQALQAATEASRRFPDNLYYPISRASLLQSRGLIDSALVVMDSVDISDVRNYSAVSNFIGYRADLLAARGDTLTALEEYDRAISLNPDNIGAMNNAAYFLSLIPGSDLEKALRYSSRAIKAEPNNATYLDTYAWVLFQSGDVDLALQYIEATLRLYEEELEENPDLTPSADIYDHAGDIYMASGQIQKALEYWNKALQVAVIDLTIYHKIKAAAGELLKQKQESQKPQTE